MAYSSNLEPDELTALTSLDSGDVFVVGDTSDANEPAKHITKTNLITDLSSSFSVTGHNHTGVYAPVLGSDDNYVTDAEKAALHSHSNKTVLDNTTASFTTAQETKVGHISITQAVDLDALETASHAAVTKTGTGTYISLSGQQITVDPIDTTDFAGGVLDTDLSSVSGSDDTIPSAKATKTALDAKAPLASPTFTGTVTLPVGLTGVLRADTGVVTVDTDVTDIVAAGTESAAGKLELATNAETVTGTDTARATTPANITAKLAAPGAIGGTTPSTGKFTSVETTGNIELGHASDTTLSRVSAGVAAIEGKTILTTDGGTLTGNITLGENTAVALDPAGSADGKYSGITVTGVAGYSQAFGDLVTLDKDDSRWEAVDISVAAAATGDARGLLGMVVSAGTDGNACTILLEGIIRADANFPALTIGAPVYASTTGDVVVTQPTTTDYVIRQVGYALTADELYFSPTGTWTTHT